MSKRRLDFTAVKAAWPIPRWLERHGIAFRGHEREVHCPCPIHGGDNPRGFSAALKGDSWVWKCRTNDCGGGDVIRLDMLMHGGSVADACRRLAGETAFPPIPTRPRVDRAAQAAREAAERAAKRETWPAMEPVTPATVARIAKLRHLPPCVVERANARGYLAQCVIDGGPCFVIREGDFAQARRLDGSPILLADGRTTKAKTLPGSVGSFIGWRTLGTDGPVLLTEGVISLLEAAGAMRLSRTGTPWRILAAVDAGRRLEAAGLARLAGRHVRIIPDADEAGDKALARWSESLTAAGIAWDSVELPDGTKDLGDLLKQPSRYAADLTTIFSEP